MTALIGAPVLVGAPAHAGWAPGYTEWNNSPDPAAIYGGCSPGPADGSRYGMILQAGLASLDNLLAVTVLRCGNFGGGSPAHFVPCPSGSPYQVCVANGNDGLGNSILLGVLERDATTNPDTRYSGCPAGNGTGWKVDLVSAAGRDPRMINGIVTLGCGPASGAGGASVVPCPSAPNPYGYCIGTKNDGNGNAVTLGVVLANGPSDKYGLYGQCGSAGQGVKTAWRAKIALVKEAYQDVTKVERIELLTCKIPQGEPATPTRVPCSVFASAPLAGRYDYCIWGADPFGNAVYLGVEEYRH